MLLQVKAVASQWLGPLYEPALGLAYALFPFLLPNNLNGVFIVSAILLAVGFYLYVTPRTSASVPHALRFLFPRRVFLHRSALVDYRFYVVNSLLLSYVRLSARVAGLVGLFVVSDRIRDFLAPVLGTGAGDGEPTGLARIGFTLAMVLAIDFAKFFAHFLQHKVPLLWEFHKVHHSAQVLTPLTNYRMHPVDVILEQFLAAILVGLVVGVYACFYPKGIAEMTILNIGAITFVYFLAANLRHSHIPLGFGWRTSHILSSPYMHQVHHSSEVRHWDKNYALVFSLWDVVFRSLYIPRGPEKFRLGLPGEENARFDSVRKLYLAPFAGAGRSIARRVSSGGSNGQTSRRT